MRSAMYTSVLLTTGLGLLLANPASGDQGVEIVRDGKAIAYIHLPSNPHAMLKEAADDLRWAVKEATGVTLEDDKGRQPGAGLPRISIIASDATTPLPYDAGVVEISPDGIDITGLTPAGVANAVATILLEDFGVRTYYPDPIFTVVPKAKTLSIRPRVARSSFDYRIWSGISGRDGKTYVRRNRLTDQRVPAPHFGFGHNLATFLNPAVLGKEHPEYFAFRDGRRRTTGKDVGDAVQPCFTNPDVVRMTIEAARKYFDKNPKHDTFSLCVNDNSSYCECPQCSALDKPYRDIPVGRQYSESYYDYVSKVAEALAQSHPGKFIGVYAYWNVEQPPRNRKKLPDNVIAALTQDILQHYDPAYREKDRDLARTWAGYVKYLHTYVYYGLGWFTPRTSPHLVADDLRFISSIGERAVYCEAYPFWGWCGPMHYVASRAQWDVNVNVERILEEFHRDLFGEAAGEMRAFHDACERYWTKPRKARWFEGLDNLGPEEVMADVAILREAGKHLEAAGAKAADPSVKRRIEYIQRDFAFTSAIGDAFEAHRAAATPEEKLKKLIAAAEAVERALARVLAESRYPEVYYGGDRFNHRCWDWFQRAIRPVANAYRKELQSSLPREEAEARWKTFAQKSGLTGLAERHKWDSLK